MRVNAIQINSLTSPHGLDIARPSCLYQFLSSCQTVVLSASITMGACRGQASRLCRSSQLFLSSDPLTVESEDAVLNRSVSQLETKKSGREDRNIAWNLIDRRSPLF